MPFHDLNLAYTTDHVQLNNTLAFNAELGYNVVALSISATGKLPAIPQKIPVSALTVPKSVKTVLTRLTITVHDAAQNHRISSFLPHYDLLALRPTTEKALQVCCLSLECDIISLDFSQRLPCILKFKTVSSALQRGIRFEISYSPGIVGATGAANDARRNLISGATALIRATRGRGIIFSSEAKNALGLRGPYDVINLAQVWGLGQEIGKEAICEEAGKVVRLAKMKRTSFRGVVDIIEGGGPTEPESVSTAKESQAVSQMQTPSANLKQSLPKSSVRELVLPSASNGVKRKATTSPTNVTADNTVQGPGDEKPISKREQKRRDKKARFEEREKSRAGAAAAVTGSTDIG